MAKEFQAPDFYFSDDAARNAIAKRGMFNILSTREGDKIDVWLLKQDAYDQSRFSRRVSQEIGVVKIPVSSPEDTILFKLHWAAKMGGSEKQFHDALSVYEAQRGALDEEYIDQWAPMLGVPDLVRRLREEAEEV